MNTRLIVFDLDGTLIDSRADLAAGINHMRMHYGLEPLSLESISGYVGDGVRLLVERSLQGAAVDFEEALQINKDYYASHLIVHTTLYDGVAEGIPRLAEVGCKLALLTNKPGDPGRGILKHFGLDGYFSVIIGGGDIDKLKPEPDGVFKCMEVADAAASNTWMVGDHYTDLAVAENAGVQSAFVEYGFGDRRKYEASEKFASFAQLVEYFVGP